MEIKIGKNVFCNNFLNFSEICLREYYVILVMKD